MRSSGSARFLAAAAKRTGEKGVAWETERVFDHPAPTNVTERDGSAGLVCLASRCASSPTKPEGVRQAPQNADLQDLDAHPGRALTHTPRRATPTPVPSRNVTDVGALTYIGARTTKTSPVHPSTAARRAATLVSAASPPVGLAGGSRVGPRTCTPGAVSRTGAVEAELVEERLADQVARAHAGRFGGFGYGVPFSGGEPGGRHRRPNRCCRRRHANVNVARLGAARADGRGAGVAR